MIADNTSAARALIGDAGIAPRDVDLTQVECTFTVDGEKKGTATGAALLGDPAECVAMLVRHLAKHDRGLRAGWIVLAAHHSARSRSRSVPSRRRATATSAM